MLKKYNSFEIESSHSNRWHEEEIYKWEKNSKREENFVIDTPPPTVSGLLHMGHVFSYVQTDFIARFQRMRGKNVFYPIGFDDNGLPTERLVEKLRKIRPNKDNREEFIKNCHEVVEDAEKEFENLFKTIALSVDWNEKYQTISDDCQKISQMSFLDLYKKSLIYRDLKPVYWDISDKTALADADLVDKEMPGAMNFIKFPIDGGGEVEIMTTRPELLGSCIAVMCHPDDYLQFVRKFCIVPLFSRKVPIIPDESVDREKGTGFVMFCTFGDRKDVEWWYKYKTEYGLEMRISISENGRLRVFDEEFSIKEAKEKILVELENGEFITRKAENITHSVKCAERSGVPIEIIPTEQYYVKIVDFKAELKKKSQECQWNPDYMRVRIEQWIDGLNQDWCISRQRFFGVAFPVWHLESDSQKVMIVAEIDELPINPINKLPKGLELDGDVLRKDYKGIKAGTKVRIRPETDVMDTWMTSSVSPQLASCAISEEFFVDKDKHAKLFPFDLRPQAHEIIRTWAFYTIVKAYFHNDSVPWRNLMISGWCLAPDGSKMSKSKGNIITPINIINQHGVDAIRYWASSSGLGADIIYNEEAIKAGKKLILKLWNAGNFAFENIVNCDLSLSNPVADIESGLICEDIDIWILGYLSRTIEVVNREFERFEYSKARMEIENFFWNGFCDNYLELVKIRYYGMKAFKYENCTLSEDEIKRVKNAQKSAVASLYHCMKSILKLFAPFLPYVTEELYLNLFANGDFSATKSVHVRGNWFGDGYDLVNKSSEIGDFVVEILSKVRKFKSENSLAANAEISKISVQSPYLITKSAMEDLKNATNCKKIMIDNNKNFQIFIE